MRTDTLLKVVFLGALTLIVLLGLVAPRDWWLTADQQAQKLFDDGQYAEAAQRFDSAQRRGVAWYRAAQFGQALAAFESVNSAEGDFNRGNTLVMLGKYDDSIQAFEQALQARPGWKAAETNLQIARLRAEQVRQQGGNSVEGQLEADEIVFSDDKNDADGQTEQTDAGEMSESELQSLWLRRIQTRPADFLKTKFAFQLTQAPTGETAP